MAHSRTKYEEMCHILPEIGQSSGMGTFPVTVVQHIWIPMNDGVRLSAKLWMPFSRSETSNMFPSSKLLSIFTINVDYGEENRFPAILEYIPYRKSDWTARRDYQRHTWMCSHGYVAARVDMRGTGDSEGLYYDEYTAQEQQDGCIIINWLSQQSWSNGRVGVYGKSWAGFNGLQLAFCQPPCLKAVISLYSTDDRYSDDVHYMGGCVLGRDMLEWSSNMLGWNARPPSPQVHGSDWKSMWLERLQGSLRPWVSTWLRHQLRDDYWRHGSICEDYSKVTCPILAIGGWADGYSNAVFRLVEHLPEARGIIGPWSHDWPDVASPGPVIEFMEICKKWWDCHLKDVSNGVMNEPKMQLFQQHSYHRDNLIKEMPGEWVAVDEYPPMLPLYTMFALAKDFRLLSDVNDISKEMFRINSSVDGSRCVGTWYANGMYDLPTDQNSDDANSTCWESEPLKTALPIVGVPEVCIRVSVEKDSWPILVGRLCDVSLNGNSTLISYGVLNLCHSNDHSIEQATSFKVDKVRDVTLSLNGICCKVSQGHRIRLAISANYWPMIWPSRDSNAIFITSESSQQSNNVTACLKLPIQATSVCSMDSSCLKLPTAMPIKELRPPGYDRAVHYNLTTGLYEHIDTKDDGRVLLHDSGTILDETCSLISRIIRNTPLSAVTEHTSAIEIVWPAECDSNATTVKINSHSSMSADYDKFYLKHSLIASCNNEQLYCRSWDDIIERQYV